jgi:hypothetical protein
VNDCVMFSSGCSKRHYEADDRSYQNLLFEMAIQIREKKALCVADSSVDEADNISQGFLS